MLKCLKGGTFLDIGCNDGIDGSNTYAFEKQFGFRGKCVEADPMTFTRIARNSGRSSGLNLAVGAKDGTTAFQRVHDGNNGLSGLPDTMDRDRNAAHGRFGSTMLSINVTTPTRLLETYYANRRIVDVVSLDVEGAEVTVLSNWPFDGRWCVTAFTIENNNCEYSQTVGLYAGGTARCMTAADPPWMAGCNATQGIVPELVRILTPHGYRHLRAVGPDEVFARDSPCRGSASEARKAASC